MHKFLSYVCIRVDFIQFRWYMYDNLIMLSTRIFTSHNYMDFMLTILDLPILESYFESRNHQNVCSKVLASKQEYLLLLVLVMGHDQNIRELSVNVISRCTIFGNCELWKWQFSLIFMILSKRFVKCCMISREIANVTRIGREWDFAI